MGSLFSVLGVLLWFYVQITTTLNNDEIFMDDLTDGNELNKWSDQDTYSTLNLGIVHGLWTGYSQNATTQTNPINIHNNTSGYGILTRKFNIFGTHTGILIKYNIYGMCNWQLNIDMVSLVINSQIRQNYTGYSQFIYSHFFVMLTVVCLFVVKKVLCCGFA